MLDDLPIFDPANIPAWFWDIIGESNKSKGILRNLLNSLILKQIEEFKDAFHDLGAFIENVMPDEQLQVSSDDDLDDIGYWIVSQGKNYYFDIINGATDFPKNYSDQEILFWVVVKVYDEKVSEIPYNGSTHQNNLRNTNI